MILGGEVVNKSALSSDLVGALHGVLVSVCLNRPLESAPLEIATTTAAKKRYGFSLTSYSWVFRFIVRHLYTNNKNIKPRYTSALLFHLSITI